MTQTTTQLTKIFARDKGISASPALKPMPFWLSAILFGIPTVFTILSMYTFLPMLERAGYSPLESFLAAFILPTALMFAAAMVAYHKIEGRPISWGAFSERMWFPRFQVRDIAWAAGIFLFGFAGIALLTPVVNRLIVAGLIPLPNYLPLLLDPHAQISKATLDQAAGGSLIGRWEFVLLYAVLFFFNNLGEEFWWRGYILPRQVLTHGHWTWLVHGLLWNLFHAFKYWQMIPLLPLTLAVSFTAFRLKSNWAALIAHSLGNISFFLLILGGVTGSI